MLILTRRVGETIVINGNILVTVTQVYGNQVRIGITAPTSIAVLREELVERDARLGRDQRLLDAVLRERKGP